MRLSSLTRLQNKYVKSQFIITSPVWWGSTVVVFMRLPRLYAFTILFVTKHGFGRYVTPFRYAENKVKYF